MVDYIIFWMMLKNQNYVSNSSCAVKYSNKRNILLCGHNLKNKTIRFGNTNVTVDDKLDVIHVERLAIKQHILIADTLYNIHACMLTSSFIQSVLRVKHAAVQSFGNNQ